ncbi:MAG: hypothetical protein OEM02_09850 [Desulfobulbaceae bacterium]|nr:hypothetical protein [Desulfobulbaceae bacterium]
MALYEITQSGLKTIPLSTFQEKQIKERDDLQRLLKNQIHVLSSELLVVAEEFGDWEDSNRRIDLLAIDNDANLVVIELKRTSDGGHMELQALRYAAMVSAMTFAQVCNAYDNYLKSNNKSINAVESILEFLNWNEPDEEEFGKDVKIILASADFSKEVTTAVIWLNERGLDIRCFRMIPHDMDGRTIIDIQQIIPLPEAESFQVKVREKTQAARTARAQKGQWDIDKLLKSIKENTSEITAEAAKNIYDWSSKLMNRIWWSEAKVDGSFIPVWDGPGDENHWFFAVRSTGKIELYLGAMAKKTPFDNIELRQEFVDRLNNLGANIPKEKSGLYPKFSMSVITPPEKMTEFKNIIEWALNIAQQNNTSTMSGS